MRLTRRSRAICSVARRCYVRCTGCGEMAMEFEILGPVTVRRDGEPVALGGPRQRALLALLLVHGDEFVPTDALIDEL